MKESEVRSQRSEEQPPAIPAEFIDEFSSTACRRFFPCTRIAASACRRVVNRKGDGHRAIALSKR
jgi:hypothetical protein